MYRETQISLIVISDLCNFLRSIIEVEDPPFVYFLSQIIGVFQKKRKEIMW